MRARFGLFVAVLLGAPFIAWIVGATLVGAPEHNGPTVEIEGEIPRVHDPVIAHENGHWYAFTTGRGIRVMTSPDLRRWERRGPALNQQPAWIAAKIPGASDSLWAPDISFFNGRWHLYYSASVFGKNTSAIGLVTSPSLDPGSPEYGWQDGGAVIESHRRDQWNAIDPNVAFDEAGAPWLAFGSFWDGLKMCRLDPATGRRPEGDRELISLARRPRVKRIGGAIEAPFIIRRHEKFYLFASFDLCCKGAKSTYNLRVGRADRITGPYLDRAGTPMLEGGGTLVRSGSERWRGPGHNAVFSADGRDWLIYHAYDAEDRGRSKLRIDELRWDRQGWPIATTP